MSRCPPSRFLQFFVTYVWWKCRMMFGSKYWMQIKFSGGCPPDANGCRDFLWSRLNNGPDKSQSDSLPCVVCVWKLHPIKSWVLLPKATQTGLQIVWAKRDLTAEVLWYMPNVTPELPCLNHGGWHAKTDTVVYQVSSVAAWWCQCCEPLLARTAEWDHATTFDDRDT